MVTKINIVLIDLTVLRFLNIKIKFFTVIRLLKFKFTVLRQIQKIITKLLKLWCE